MSDQRYLFVSYAHADVDAVLGDVGRLNAAGVSTWYDKGIPGGAVWREAIAARIADSAACLVFLSRHSAASEYCLQELNFALDEGKPIVAVLLEDFRMSHGLRMSLGHRQILRRPQPADEAWFGDLLAAARAALTEPVDRTSMTQTALFAETLVLTLDGYSTSIPPGYTGRYLVGRETDCQLRLDSPYVSRHHGFFQRQRQTFTWTDTSSNGSILRGDAGNEELITRREVVLPRSGVLVLGDVELVFALALPR